MKCIRKQIPQLLNKQTNRKAEKEQILTGPILSENYRSNARFGCLWYHAVNDMCFGIGR